MKKYIFMAMAALAVSFGFTSCDDNDIDPGGTAVEEMAGEWVVTVDAADADGNEYEDPYNLGQITISTYNTAANDPDSLWINDNGYFWNFTFKMGVNYAAKTFSADDVPYDSKGSGNATVTDGRIMLDAAKNRHGMPNDSIDFKISFTDDTPGIVYHVHGQRYTGFVD